MLLRICLSIVLCLGIVEAAGLDYEFRLVTKLPASTYEHLAITYTKAGICQTGFVVNNLENIHLRMHVLQTVGK